MNVAIMAYTFNPLWRDGRLDLFGYLESCRYRYGLQYADLWNHMFASIEDEYVAKVKDGLAERELTVANLAVDGAHIWDPDPDVREKHYQNALAHMRVAEALGAQTLRIDAGGSRDAQTFTDEEFDFIVRRYREYAQRAHDHGYRIGPENHWGPTTNPVVLKQLCEAVDHPAFGVLLHSERWQGQEAERGDELVAPWTMHTHFGRGVLESRLDAKLDLLEGAGYRGCWSIEHPSTGYSEPALLLALLRDALERRRVAG